MISSIFNTVIYEPLYNALVLLIKVVPFSDVGIAVIILTILVKFLLLPLAHKSSQTQQKIRDVSSEIERIKEKYKDKQEQTLKTLDLYKKNGIKPFSSILLMFAQIPFIMGLYWVFFKGGLPAIDTSLLYSFITSPDNVNMSFLGFFDMAGRSIFFALSAGASQYYLSKLTLPKPGKKPENPTMKDDLAHSMHLQMRFVMPIIITVIAFTISAAVAVYWTTSNIFTIIQEIRTRKHKRESHD